MDFSPESIQNMIEIALKVVGAAALVATVTPNPTDNVILGVAKQVLNVLAANFGKAKNAE